MWGKLLKWWRENGHCEYCGKKIDLYDNKSPWLNLLSFDHRTPIAHGGDSRINNIAFVCVQCNFLKSTLTEQTYRKMIEKINDERLLYQIFMELRRGRIAYKKERDKLLEEQYANHESQRELLPEHLQWSFLQPTPKCPICGYPLSAYFGKHDLLCLNCTSLDKKEKIFKIVAE